MEKLVINSLFSLKEYEIIGNKMVYTSSNFRRISRMEFPIHKFIELRTTEKVYGHIIFLVLFLYFGVVFLFSLTSLGSSIIMPMYYATMASVCFYKYFKEKGNINFLLFLDRNSELSLTCPIPKKRKGQDSLINFVEALNGRRNEVTKCIYFRIDKNFPFEVQSENLLSLLNQDIISQEEYSSKLEELESLFKNIKKD